MDLTTDYPERIIPDEVPPGILALHLKRYEFARTYVPGKRVLDVACGVGYGSSYLAEKAASVIGVDIDAQSVAYARTHYGRIENLTFARQDATRLPYLAGQFDRVCSFETIEHLSEVDAFLSEVKRVLVPGGVFIVSTPCAERSTMQPANPYHAQEWSPADFQRLLLQFFSQVEMFGQQRRQTTAGRWLKGLDILGLRKRVLPLWLTRRVANLVGVRATPDLQMEDVLIRPGELNGASEMIAVCHNRRMVEFNAND